ncbi:MAG: XrtA/PEP-CTERM system histidine kinase PrsK [Pseudohongiellaceae bacterium]
MLINIGLITYLAACAGFTVLGILLAVYRRDNPQASPLLFACAATATWAAVVATGSVSKTLPITLVHFSELVRDVCWLFLLFQLLGLQVDGSSRSIGGWRWQRLFAPVLVAALALIAIRPLLPIPASGTDLHYQLIIVLWLSLSLLGLLMIEQLYRNATESARWSIKYLCLGLGILLAYDFFMYAEALLFRELDRELWQARGLVNALATPLLAVAIARSSNWQVNLQISRQLAFHTVTLSGAGLYLMGMAAAGYAIRYLGGSWGSVLQMGFLAAAGALLVILLFSGKLRARLRVLLSKHFFTYRYDYREEWLKFTRALANLDDNVAEGIIRTMAPLASSPAGMLWASDDGHPMLLLAHWEMPLPPAGSGLGPLPDWLEKTNWVIDLDEWQCSPDIYTGLQLPAWLQKNEPLWLIIPLIFRDRLQAVLMLKRSPLKNSLNWEDRDLLKTAGRQAATHLAQHMANKALVEARQFDAFNRLSAYVVHDLKNILAQQSLIVSNAGRHRNNPEFIDDMISTVEHSVSRMHRLMEQMRNGVRSAPANSVHLVDLLRKVIEDRTVSRPLPRAEFTVEDYTIEADRERLTTVFTHMIQNAQEATSDQGEVNIRLDRDTDTARVYIEDNGRGMSADFIRDRLFRPFESTKGLTGMGIGAFESREYIRQLGGDISVVSTPGKGTTFQVVIPLAISHATTDRDRYGKAAHHE